MNHIRSAHNQECAGERAVAREFGEQQYKKDLETKKKRERETMLNIKTEWGIVRAGLKRGPVKQN